MSSTRKPRSIFDWKAILGILLSIGLLYWAFRDVDLHEIVAELRRADPLWFLFACALATVVFPLRAWRTAGAIR